MFRRTNRFALHRRVFFLFFILISLSLLYISLKDKRNSSFSSSIIDQIVVLVRTSHHCQFRLNYLFQSWIPTSQSKIYILTDDLSKYTNTTLVEQFPNFIETKCPPTHDLLDLCCKTASEFEFFYNLSRTNANLQWLCRFDDDQYVNLNNLYKFLSTLDSSKPYYIGRISALKPTRIPRSARTYYFATYGAGVCFSRPLLHQLEPYVNKTIFPSGCRKLGKSDDGYVGYLVQILLNVSFTSLPDIFHSHLEQLDSSFRTYTINDLQNAITLGFAWDRYDLPWLPIIHQLIELNIQRQDQAIEQLWLFLRNYEKTHPENLRNKYDRSCSLYQREI